MSAPAIRVMDPHLAAKIAAGEVIERPASVVKELVENALDAGARSIRVEIQEGGLERLTVADDGCGMPAEQVAVAFRRRATSKLAREEDLADLRTLGFRGEALPSIATVSDVTCTTRSAEEPVGLELRIEQGVLDEAPVARQPGTTVVVDALFRRFPARRKFMRARAAEAAACVQVIAPLALAFPEVRFDVLVDGRETLRTPGDGTSRHAAVAVLGTEAAAHLVEIPRTELEDENGCTVIAVEGLCATGSYHRSARSGLYLTVNRRPIQHRALAFAVSEAYGSLIPTGRFPVALVRIEVPPGEVDFNVHPSKLEVKLLRERAVYGAVQRAIRSALESGPWQIAGWTQAPPASAAMPAETAGAPEAAEALLDGGERLEQLRVLGQAGRTYVIAEGDAGVYLVDQHAAHERVLLEALRETLAGRGERQALLEPLIVDLPDHSGGLPEPAIESLRALGFEAEPFGPRQVLLRMVPAVVAQRRPDRIVQESLSALATETHGLSIDHQATWPERLALILSCKSAVRAGDTLTPPEMQALLRQLGEARLCHTCAHGRPTAILLSHAHLERQFGRR